MLKRLSLFLPAIALGLVVISGCASTGVGISSSTADLGGGANMMTYITSPQSGQVFPAGKDIPVTATAMDLSGVNQVTFLVNGKQIAKDSQPPFAAVIAKPVPGQYAIQSYATSRYGDAKLSTPLVITVK